MKKLSMLVLAIVLMLVGCKNSDPNMVGPASIRQKELARAIGEMQGMSTTFVYLKNEAPVPTKGITAMGGKLAFLGEGKCFGSKWTNIQEFSSAPSGTWIFLKNGDGSKPALIQGEIIILPHKLPFD